MNPKSVPVKTAGDKPTRKIRKGTAETTRLFIDTEGMTRPQAPSSRYVE